MVDCWQFIEDAAIQCDLLMFSTWTKPPFCISIWNLTASWVDWRPLQVGFSFFIKYCDALIMSSSIQLLQDSKMSLCHFVSTIPQQLSQTLLCEEDVEPASISSQSMSTSCVVAFSLLVQVCPGWQSDVQGKPAVLHLHVLLLWHLFLHLQSEEVINKNAIYMEYAWLKSCTLK